MSRSSRLRLVYRAWRYRWRNDPAEIALVRAEVRAGSVALDIGAHKGGYTYWLARGVGAAGHVHAFEPQPELARRLAACFEPARVTVVNAAASDRPGTVRLHLPGDGRPTPGATVEAAASASAGRSIEVPAVTLDDYLARCGRQGRPVSFVKCDVEGHELSVFRGGEALLRRDRPVLLFECEQRHHGAEPVARVFDHLAGLGYSGAFFHRGRLAPLAEFDPGRHQDPGRPDDYCNNFVFRPGKSQA